MIKSHSELLNVLKSGGQEFPRNIIEDLAIFRFCFFLRKIQETLIANYEERSEIRCPVHFGLGQELTYGVLSRGLKKNDILFSHHRSHGSYFAKNGDLNQFFLELHGRIGGACSGFSGSQEISSSVNNMHAGAIVAGSIGLAVGGAFSIKLFGKSSDISVGIFGDGATNQGLFYESMNYASLKNLPVLLICENNLFATYSRIDQHTVDGNLQSKIVPFGVKYLSTSTFLPAHCISEINAGIEYVRKIRKPAIIEVFTYRYNPHVGPQDDTGSGYRSVEDIAHWKTYDALDNFMKVYSDAPWMPEFKGLLKLDEQEVERSYEAARVAPLAEINFTTMDAIMSNTFSSVSSTIPRLNLINTLKQQELTTPGPY
jgi:pyruvate dehydrogenase E1 component alpha subunit